VGEGTVATTTRLAVIVAHIALCVVLVAMVVPELWRVPAQLMSGYVPPWYPMFVALLATPLILGILVLLTLVPWLRGRRRWLIWVDVTTTVAAWTALLVFLFASDLPLLLLVLAPVAVFLSVLVPTRGSWSESKAPRRGRP
jgi:hypothetical protein